MTHRFYTLPLLFLASALLLAGCDQSSQNIDFSSGDTYIINSAGSALANSTPTNVVVPDTVDYFVQAFTIDKDYTWRVNDTEPPTETRADQTYVWQRRQGEFISVVFSPEDPIATTGSETTTHVLTVDASPDDISPDSMTITAQYPNIATQVSRLPSFSTLADLATSAGLADSSALGNGGTFTLLGPQNAALSGLSAIPTQATDADEPASSSVRADILKYHTIPASVASGDISDGQTVSTLYGDQTLTFSVSGDQISVDGAQVVRPDIPVTNENFHGIDGLLTPSTASLDFTDRTPSDSALASTAPDTTLEDGNEVVIDGSFFPADANGGGFVVLHDSTQLANGQVLASIVGKSEYVEPGIQNEIRVELDESITDTTSFAAMAHRDSDGDETYDFETSGGTQDGPYTLSGSPVIDYGVIQIP
jgi:uncharacterized surface protein with fasciclin (FAS1) repeats